MHFYYKFLSQLFSCAVTEKKILAEFSRVSMKTRGRLSQSFLSSGPSPLLPSISCNRSLSLGHLHGNSQVHLHTSRGVCPEARIETTSLPPADQEGCMEGRVGGQRGGKKKRGTRRCAQDEAAGGESVLRILEVMSREVLYNTRSRLSQSSPFASSSFYATTTYGRHAAFLYLPYYEDPDEKWKQANPSVYPPTSFIFKRLKNFSPGDTTSRYSRMEAKCVYSSPPNWKSLQDYKTSVQRGTTF